MMIERSDNGPQCLVVMYHYVRDPPDDIVRAESDGIHGLSPDEFRHQVDELGHWGEPIDWPDLYAAMEGRAELPERSFLLTFDDGLADHAETVLPILQERKLRGVFFVPGNVLTEHRMLAAHAIHLLLDRMGEAPLSRALVEYLSECRGGITWANALADPKPNAQAASMYHYEPESLAALKHFLTVQLPIPIRDGAVQVLFERYVGSSEVWARRWYLGWDDLIELQSCGHTVGGHGFSHEPLPRMVPADRLLDIQRSAWVLREGLGFDVRPFSYPFGRYDDGTAGDVRRAGFAHAFTTECNPAQTTCDPLQLPRIDTMHFDGLLREEAACSVAT